ncbi:MAG: response regulator [bacterium]|nr:response regulator [bacterium]
MKGYNILLVDDSRTALVMIERMIREIGIPIAELSTAGNGLEAIDFLNEKEVDLILTDVVMPELDGIGLIKYLKSSDFSTIPIIPITSLGSQKEIDIFREHGITLFMTKAVSKEKLKEILCLALKPAGGADSWVKSA